jgi:hypothetical protein
VAVADFNHDGKDDLAVVAYIDSTVSIMLGTGTGTFGAPVNIYPAASHPIRLALADLNNDGWLDIVTANYFDDNASVLLNTGHLCNNSCSDPSPVYNGVTMVFSTVGATTDGPTEANLGFCCGDLQVNQDVWFLYTAGCSGTTSVSLCGSNYDTKVAVYAGTACPTANNTAIAGNDDSATCGNNQSYTTFPCTQGAQYLIRVGGYTTGVGTVHMLVNCVGTCGSADFNGDGDVGTDADIEAFFRVLAGGHC